MTYLLIFLNVFVLSMLLSACQNGDSSSKYSDDYVSHQLIHDADYAVSSSKTVDTPKEKTVIFQSIWKTLVGYKIWDDTFTSSSMSGNVGSVDQYKFYYDTTTNEYRYWHDNSYTGTSGGSFSEHVSVGYYLQRPFLAFTDHYGNPHAFIIINAHKLFHLQTSPDGAVFATDYFGSD